MKPKAVLDVYRTRSLRRSQHWAWRIVAENGREALTALEQFSFDVVLMDVEMPEMDGLEATRVWRTREAGTGRHLPIIAMTAHAVEGYREHCLAQGMDGYVTKPIWPEELFAALQAATTKNFDGPVRV